MADACRAPVTDPEALLTATWTEGTPMGPLLEEIRGRLGEEQAKWVHYGTTTQDVIDTATMLQAREALDLLDSGLVSVASLMAGLVRRAPRPAADRADVPPARPTHDLRDDGGRLAGAHHFAMSRS